MKDLIEFCSDVAHSTVNLTNAATVAGGLSRNELLDIVAHYVPSAYVEAVADEVAAELVAYEVVVTD